MATNQLLLKLKRVRGDALIKDVTINQVSDAHMRCKQSVIIDLTTFQDQIGATLRNMLQNLNTAKNVNNFKLVQDISQVFTMDVMNSCVAAPINQVLIDIETVGENFKLENYDLNQKAKAELTRCVQEGKIRMGPGKGDPTLPDYLATMEDYLLLVTEPPPPPPPPCPDPPKDFTTELIVTVLTCLAVMVGCLVYGIYLLAFQKPKTQKPTTAKA